MTGPASGFELWGVVHLIHPWGEPIHDIEELRPGIAVAPDDVLFHHTVQYTLRHPGAGEMPPDDFSAWVGETLQDRETAERLAFAIQTRNSSAAELQPALGEVLEKVSRSASTARRTPPGREFEFLAAVSVTIPTGVTVHGDAEFMEALVELDPSVWFYHLLEEPWRTSGPGALLEWLGSLGQSRLAGWLREAAGEGLPIEKARSGVMRRWRRSRLARQISDAAHAPDDVRREAGRQTMARLARRVTGSGSSS